MVKANVTVHLKPGISDPEGQTTTKALHLLGFPQVKAAHSTRVWTLELDGLTKAQAKAEVDRMCKRLLTNPVIHDYSVEIL